VQMFEQKLSAKEPKKGRQETQRPEEGSDERGS
jgi:hypothetical protein